MPHHTTLTFAKGLLLLLCCSITLPFALSPPNRDVPSSSTSTVGLTAISSNDPHHQQQKQQQDCPITFADLNSTQLASLPPTCFAHATSKMLASMADSPDASQICSGLSSSQTSQLSYIFPDACSGLTSGCATSLPPSGLSGLTSDCLTSSSSDFLGALPASSMPFIPVAAFPSLTADQLSSLSDGCAGLTQQQVVGFGQFTSSESCNGLTRFCGRVFSLNGLTGLTANCMHSLKWDFISSLNSTQISAIQGASFKGMTHFNMVGLNSNCAGLDALQVTFFERADHQACTSLTQRCAESFSLEGLRGLGMGCLSHVSPQFIAALSAQQVKAISSKAFGGFTKANLPALGASCEGVREEQLNNLGFNVLDVCKALSAQCLGAIKPNSFSGLRATCTTYLQPQQLNATSLQSILQLNSNSVMSFKAPVWSYLIQRFGDKLVGGLSQYQLDYFDYDINVLSALHGYVDQRILTPFRHACPVSPSPPPVIGSKGVTWLQLCLSDDNITDCFTPKATSQLIPMTYIGFRGPQIRNLCDSCFSMVSDQQIGYLTSDAIANIRLAHIANMTPETFAGLNKDVISLSASAAPAITPQQIEAIGVEVGQRWPCPLVRALSRESEQKFICLARDASTSMHLDEFYHRVCALQMCVIPISSSSSSPSSSSSSRTIIPPHKKGSSSSREIDPPSGWVAQHTILVFMIGVSSALLVVMFVLSIGLFVTLTLLKRRHPDSARTPSTYSILPTQRGYTPAPVNTSFEYSCN